VTTTRTTTATTAMTTTATTNCNHNNNHNCNYNCNCNNTFSVPQVLNLPVFENYFISTVAMGNPYRMPSKSHDDHDNFDSHHCPLQCQTAIKNISTVLLTLLAPPALNANV